MKRNTKKMKVSSSETRLNMVITFFMVLVGIVIAYPLIYVVSCSFSSPEAVMSGKVTLFPVDISLEGYRAVFRNRKVVMGFLNSVLYTSLQTVISTTMCILAAYPLSRKELPGRSFMMMMFTFTMIFSGGMIPSYLLIRDMKLMNTIWAIVLPSAVVVYHVILMRTFFVNSIPEELFDAAQMDGCSYFAYLIKIVVPLSKSIIAVIALYCAVMRWNSYFSEFMYLSDSNKYNLQMILREILISNQIEADMVIDDMVGGPVFGLEYILKYALIVVATVPMLIAYPFVQKHFVKGVMIGAVKG